MARFSRLEVLNREALLGPCPWTRILPTGIREVTKAGITAWFQVGIVAAGIGRQLLKKEWVEQRDYAAITRRADEIRQWAREAREARGQSRGGRGTHCLDLAEVRTRSHTESEISA